MPRGFKTSYNGHNLSVGNEEGEGRHEGFFCNPPIRLSTAPLLSIQMPASSTANSFTL
jgi:hypothetical protein